MDREISPVQDTPIITDEELELLKSVKFIIKIGKAPNVKELNKDLYMANDKEFVQYMVKNTKMSRNVLDTLGEDGWNNVNRIPLRLRLVKQYYNISI